MASADDMERAKNLMAATAIFAKLEPSQKAELLDFADEECRAPSWGHDLGILDADYCSELGDCSTLNTVGCHIVDMCQIWWDARQEIVKGIEAMRESEAQDREVLRGIQSGQPAVALHASERVDRAYEALLDQINTSKI